MKISKVTEIERKDIIESYTLKNETLATISKRYKSTSATIRKILISNGINIRSNHTSFLDTLSEEDKNNIIELYVGPENLEIQELAKIYNCRRETMSITLKKLNIQTKRKNKQAIKYNIDKTFFEKIDTEEKAYWLGFLYADGCVLNVRNKVAGFRIQLSSIDIEHLEKFKKHLNSEHPIVLKEGRMIQPKNKKYQGHESASITIYSQKIGQDLVNLNCIANKTLYTTFPDDSIIPNNLKSHFIRGIFDGDGSLTWNNERNNYRKIQIAGTENLLIGIRDFLDFNHNIYKIKDTNIYSLEIGSREDILKFYNLVYKDSTIFLDRKNERFQHFLELNFRDGEHYDIT